VEVGYGLAPSARGHGYAAEALVALLRLAAEHGLSRAVAETDRDNAASRRTLARAGFHHVASTGNSCRYEVLLDATGDPATEPPTASR
jgi:RimJ/RimL family protein N-acetyltransferase